MSRNQRLGYLGIAAVIAVIAIVILATSGAGPDETSTQAASTPTATATPSATESAGTPTATPKPEPPLLTAGSIKKLEFKEGDTVAFRVRNDAPEEVHVHGYDIKKDLEAGKTATISFKATITGIFEIELEQSAQQLAELRVDPK